MKFQKLKQSLAVLSVAAVTVMTMSQLEPWQRPLLSGDLDINTIDYNDIQSITIANPSGTLFVNEIGSYPIQSVYLTFVTEGVDAGFINGEALQNSPLQLVSGNTPPTIGEASISNKNIVVHKVPFSEFTVKMTYAGVESAELTVASPASCSDAFITAIEPNGGIFDLNDPADLGTPSHAQLNTEDLIAGNTFRFLADNPNDAELPPLGAVNFVTEVRLVNDPFVLNQKARIIEQNGANVVLEVGAVQGDLNTTLSNWTYAFGNLAEDYVYIDAVINDDGLLLVSEEYGNHTDHYTCQLNNQTYLNSSTCFDDEGQDGLYGFNPVKTLDGPLEVGKTYPVTVNTQGGDYTWKSGNESIGTIQPLSEVEDSSVNATADFVSAALSGNPTYNVNSQGTFDSIDCDTNQDAIVTQCQVTFSLPIKYTDDGSHEAVITADGEALNNVSLTSQNGFSGTVSGSALFEPNEPFTMSLNGKVTGSFSFTVNEGIYSGGGSGNVESTVQAQIQGGPMENIIGPNEIKAALNTALVDPSVFTETNLSKTAPFSINLQKGDQGGSNSIALLKALAPGEVTIFAEDSGIQCLLAKTFEVIEPPKDIKLNVDLKRLGSGDVLKGTLLNFWSKISSPSDPVTLADVSIFLVKPSSNTVNTVEEIDADGGAVWHELFVFLQQVQQVEQGQNEEDEEGEEQQEEEPQEQQNVLNAFSIYNIPFQIPNGANIFNGNYWLYFLLTTTDNHETKAIFPIYIGPQSNMDVNTDGLLNIVDLILIFQISTGNLIPTQEQLNAADVNKDGQVTVVDVILAYQKIFKA